MMRAATILTVLVLAIGQANCQKESLSIPQIGKVLWSIQSAKGWTFNEEGQWLSTSNKILGVRMSAAEKTLWNYGRSTVGLDNFKYIELRTIKIDTTTYYILIKRMTDGYYKYSSIAEGWTNFPSIKFLVFNKPYFDDPDTINIRIRADLFYWGTIIVPGSNYFQQIGLQINKQRMDKNDDERYLYGSNHVEFLIYRANKLCKFWMSDLEPDGKAGLLFISDYSEYMLKEKPIEGFYYEAPFAGFESLLKYVDKD